MWYRIEENWLNSCQLKMLKRLIGNWKLIDKRSQFVKSVSFRSTDLNSRQNANSRKNSFLRKQKRLVSIKDLFLSFQTEHLSALQLWHGLIDRGSFFQPFFKWCPTLPETTNAAVWQTNAGSNLFFIPVLQIQKTWRQEMWDKISDYVFEL